MKKTIFYIIVLIGVMIIIAMSIIIPNNPNKIIPSITHFSISKPLWLDILISSSFIYFIIIYNIYEKIIK